MKTTFMSASDLPQDIAAIQTFNRIEEAFPFEDNQAAVVIEGENVQVGADDAGDRRALASRRSPAPHMHRDIETEYSKDGTVAQVTIPMDGNGNDDVSKDGPVDAAQRHRPRDGRQHLRIRRQRHRATPLRRWTQTTS